MEYESFYLDSLNEFVKAKINADECSFRVLKLRTAQILKLWLWLAKGVVRNHEPNRLTVLVGPSWPIWFVMMSPV